MAEGRKDDQNGREKEEEERMKAGRKGKLARGS